MLLCERCKVNVFADILEKNPDLKAAFIELSDGMLKDSIKRLSEESPMLDLFEGGKAQNAYFNVRTSRKA